MSELTIEVNSAKFFAALNELQFHYGLNAKKVSMYGMVKLIDRLWDFMPSKTKGIGTKSIRKDFSEQFIDDKYFKTNFISRRKTASAAKQQDKIRQYFANGEYDKLRLIQLKPGGLLQDVDIKAFNVTDIHRDTRHRIVRTGKMILVTNPETLKQEIKQRQETVGRAKGSFIPARTFFGESKAPKWIKSNASGYHSMSGDTKATLLLIAGSNLNYAGKLDQQYSLVNRVYQTKTRDIERMIQVDVLNKYLSVTLA